MTAKTIWNMSSNMELYKDYLSFKGHEYIMSFISEFTIYDERWLYYSFKERSF